MKLNNRHNLVSLFFVLVLCLISACGTEKNEQEKYISGALARYLEKEEMNNKILITSDLNCSDCLSKFFSKESLGLQGNEKVICLIHRTRLNDDPQLLNLKEMTKDYIIWKNVKDLDLLNAVSTLTDTRSGMYLVWDIAGDDFKIRNVGKY